MPDAQRAPASQRPASNNPAELARQWHPASELGRGYKRLTLGALRLTKNSWFSGFMLVSVVACGILVGFQAHEKTATAFGGEVDDVYSALDNIIMVIFTLDVVIQVTAFVFLLRVESRVSEFVSA